MSKKRCSHCKEWKSKKKFPRASAKPDGLFNWCKECKNANARERWATSPHIRNLAYLNSLKSRYGISPLAYGLMVAEQSGKCAICGIDPSTLLDLPEKYRRLHVDHWHDDLYNVRGLLCHNCNFGVGRWLDNREILEAAIAYLDEHDNSKCSFASESERVGAMSSE